jgi:hypothetical protein
MGIFEPVEYLIERGNLRNTAQHNVRPAPQTLYTADRAGSGRGHATLHTPRWASQPLSAQGGPYSRVR